LFSHTLAESGPECPITRNATVHPQEHTDHSTHESDDDDIVRQNADGFPFALVEALTVTKEGLKVQRFVTEEESRFIVVDRFMYRLPVSDDIRIMAEKVISITKLAENRWSARLTRNDHRFPVHFTAARLTYAAKIARLLTKRLVRQQLLHYQGNAAMGL
jgi:hypothetical protein